MALTTDKPWLRVSRWSARDPAVRRALPDRGRPGKISVTRQVGARSAPIPKILT